MVEKNYPPTEISKSPKFGRRDYEQIILWMLANNEECQWSDFTQKPLSFSTSTLSKYFNLLKDKGYADNYQRGYYRITNEGQKRYYEISRIKDKKQKLNFPPEVIKRKRNYDDWILWMVYNNTFCRWSDFTSPPLSINQSSLSKNVNLLLDKGLIEKDNKNYKITNSGKFEYSKMLSNYDLDRQSILDEESKRIEEITRITVGFFEKHEIFDENIQFRFLNNILKLDYSRVKSMLTDQQDFEKILLFLSINHPNQYPSYITIKEFAQNYEINESKLIYYIDEIVENNIYPIKFFKLMLSSDTYYYFQENERIELILRAITENHITKSTYLNKLKSKSIDMITTINNILEDICNTTFNSDLRDALRVFLLEYINYLAYKIETKVEFKEAYDKLNALIWQNMINIFEMRNDVDLEFEFIGQSEVNYKIDPEILEALNSFLLPKKDSIIKLFGHLIEKKEYHKVLEMIESSIESNQNNVLLIILKGISLCFLHRSNDLIEFLEKNFKFFEVEEVDQNRIILYFLLVFSNLSIGNFDVSEQYVQNLLSEFFNHPLSHVAAGLLSGYNISYRFDTEKASKVNGLEELDKAINLDSNKLNKGLYLELKSKILLQMNDYEKSLNNIDEAIKIVPKRVELYYTKSSILMYFNKYNELLILLDFMIDAFPKNKKELMLKKALIYKQIGKIESGFDLIETLLESYPNDSVIINCQAYWYLYMNKKEKAIQLIQNLIKLEPENALNYDTYGEILMYYQKYDKAIEQFQKALKKSKFGALIHEMYIKLGICYKEIKNYNKALENLKAGKKYTEMCFCDYETKQKWSKIADLFILEIEQYL